jgi:hypothetical protein
MSIEPTGMMRSSFSTPTHVAAIVLLLSLWSSLTSLAQEAKLEGQRPEYH